MVATTFATEMLQTVRRRHCERHPLTEAWVRGELSREQLGKWATEHYHYTKDLYFFCGRILANCPVPAGRVVIPRLLRPCSCCATRSSPMRGARSTGSRAWSGPSPRVTTKPSSGSAPTRVGRR